MQSPKIGIIGGSGLYDMDRLVNRRHLRVTTPYGEPSDELLLGEIAGREVVFLARHGRGHRVLPSELNHRANIWAMKSLGVVALIGVGAVGSLHEQYRPCDIVLVDQFVDRTKKSAEHTFFGDGIVAHVGFADPICEDLRKILLTAAREHTDRVHDGGIYLNMEGPAFSTRAESRLHHDSGFAVVGMTNLGEARCAREAEIPYATLSMVTDYDSWKPHETPVTVEMVIGNLMKNAALAQRIIATAVPRVPLNPNCDCTRALASGLVTDRKLWPDRRVEALRPLLAKYL